MDCTCWPIRGTNPYCPVHGTPPIIITLDRAMSWQELREYIETNYERGVT